MAQTSPFSQTYPFPPNTRANDAPRPSTATRSQDGKLVPELATRTGALGLFMACLAEFACTATFIFLSTGAVTSGCHTADTAQRSGATSTLENVAPGACFLGSTNLLTIAIAFGFTIFIMVYAAANLSGAHLNPAITLAMLLAGRISVLRALLYIPMQMAGACLGSVLVKAIDPSGYRAALGAANRLNSWTTVGGAVGVEILLTAILVFVVFAATDSWRAMTAAHLPVLAPLAIGMTVFVAHIVAVPIDGCSINPARSFGVAAVSHQWDHQWVFWVAPLVGGCVAGVAYEWLAARMGEVHGALPLDEKTKFAPAGAVAAAPAGELQYV